MASKFIQKAHLKTGAFTAKANAAGESVHEYAEAKQNAPGLLGRQARLALTFEGMAHRRAAVTKKLRSKKSGGSSS